MGDGNLGLGGGKSNRSQGRMPGRRDGKQGGSGNKSVVTRRLLRLSPLPASPFPRPSREIKPARSEI